MSDINPADKLTELTSIFKTAKKILILIKKDPSFDSLSSATALYLAIKKAGKDVDCYCETPTIVESANLVGINKITKEIGNKNLIISFDYVEGAIDKVSYNIEGNKFNLVIQPKDGLTTISPEKVNYSYSGIYADLIFCIDCQNLSDLGKIAEKEKEFLAKTLIVNINNTNNSQFAKFNLNTPGVFSTAELALSLFQPLELVIDQDIASNILMGIEFASGSFSDPRLDATTFETVAYLLRQGAKRQKVPQKNQKAETVTSSPSVRVEEKKEQKPATSAPVDWLQPKIYKGGQLL